MCRAAICFSTSPQRAFVGNPWKHVRKRSDYISESKRQPSQWRRTTSPSSKKSARSWPTYFSGPERNSCLEVNNIKNNAADECSSHAPFPATPRLLWTGYRPFRTVRPAVITFSLSSSSLQAELFDEIVRIVRKWSIVRDYKYYTPPISIRTESRVLNRTISSTGSTANGISGESITASQYARR